MARLCIYCGSGNGHHGACPKALCTDGAERQRIWQEGYEDGRSGKEEMSQNVTYLLGFNHGAVAFEEAQNGFDPVAEGRQW